MRPEMPSSLSTRFGLSRAASVDAPFGGPALCLTGRGSSMRKRRFAALAILVLITAPLFAQAAADQYEPNEYFGGNKLYIGMSESDALTALRSCCELSPGVEKAPSAGQFIVAKNPSTQPILGTIWFSEGTVVSISRELAPDVDTSSDDLVGFVRVLVRALPEGQHSAVLTLKHEGMSNGSDDLLTVVLPNGRGLEIRVGTLDKPDAMNKRDFVTLDETLGPGVRR